MTKRSRLSMLAVLAATTSAQDVTKPVVEGLLPFRNPQQNIEAPVELFRDLQVMLTQAEQAGPAKLSYDAEGREICDDELWRQARQRIRGKMHNMAGWFGILLRDTRNVQDRRLSAYGMGFLENPAEVCELIPFLAGEPERSIREPAMVRAIEFLRVHLRANKPPAETVRQRPLPPGGLPPSSLHTVEAGPFVAMLALDDPRDQRMGLWFLKELAGIRAEVAKPLLAAAQQSLTKLVHSDDASVREQARGLVLACDPKRRALPPADADEEATTAWLAEVLHDVFPPIRVVSHGRIDLHPGKERDQVVAIGRDVLAREAIGEPFSGQLANGQFYRGWRLARLPEPLDQLGLAVGTVITSVNGQPVAKGTEVLAAVETMIELRRAIFVEFVEGNRQGVIEYRVVE